MSNHTTARELRRQSESVDILTLQILGLISREGQGQFFLTEKFDRLSLAVARNHAGETLLREEQELLRECEALITRH